MSAIERAGVGGGRRKGAQAFARGFVVSVAVTAWAALSTGCAMGEHARTADNGQAVALQAPVEMQGVVTALMMHRASRGRWPASLDELVERDLLSASAGEALSGHAYAPGGLGLLEDGRIILLVEPYIRAGERAWCVLESSEVATGATGLEMEPVSIDALRRAARQGE